MISEHIATLLHRARWTSVDVARATGIHKQTVWRKINGGSAWYYAEVAAIAAALAVTVEELATGLPTREEWQARWDELRACRDSNPKPSDLESRPVLTLVRGTLTANRRMAVVGPVALRAVV